MKTEKREPMSVETLKLMLTTTIDSLHQRAEDDIREFHDRLKKNGIRSAVSWSGVPAMRAEETLTHTTRLKTLVEKVEDVPKLKEMLLKRKADLEDDLLTTSAFAWDTSTSAMSNQNEKASRMAQATVREYIGVLLNSISEYEESRR